MRGEWTFSFRLFSLSPTCTLFDLNQGWVQSQWWNTLQWRWLGGWCAVVGDDGGPIQTDWIRLVWKSLIQEQVAVVTEAGPVWCEDVWDYGVINVVNGCLSPTNQAQKHQLSVSICQNIFCYYVFLLQRSLSRHSAQATTSFFTVRDVCKLWLDQQSWSIWLNRIC